MTESTSPFATADYPQLYGVVSSLGYTWDVATLQWIKATGGGGGGGGAVTIADGADVAEGVTTDAAVVTDTAGTVSGKLRGLVKWAFERMPASLGQKAMAASLPVVIASDQSAISVTSSTTFLTAEASNVNLSWGQGDPVALSVDLSGNLRVGARDCVRLDEASSTITYVGTAAPGTLTSAAAWAIKRLDSTSGLVVLWADGDPQSDNIWDNRAGLSYS